MAASFVRRNPNQLFVTIAHDGAGLGTVSALKDADNGALSPIGSSPFANGQTGTCWVVISRGGRYLFAVDTGTGQISRYSIAHDGTLTLLGNTPVVMGGGVGAVDAGLTPDDSYLYVDESAADALGVFAVSGGSLTELATSPVSLPAGATPAGVVVN